MGQYFKGVILSENFKGCEEPSEIVDIVLSPRYFNQFAKICEHAFVTNPFVDAAVRLLAGQYYGRPFVWCGDYAPNIAINNGAIWVNPYDVISDWLEDNEGNERKGMIALEHAPELQADVYIVNIDKKECIKVPASRPNKLIFHPLPLFCAAGNGEGGGDYFGSHEDFVGSWAYNRIGVVFEKPNGFKMLKIKFRYSEEEY